MSIDYKKYLDGSTQMLITIASYTDIEKVEKEYVISSFVDELLSNVSNTDSLPNYEYRIGCSILTYIDGRITHILRNVESEKKELEAAKKHCKRGISIVEDFATHGWILPELNYENMAETELLIDRRIEAGSISQMLIDMDEEISEKHSIMKKEPTIKGCEALFSMAEQLEKGFAYTKEKKINLPNIKNADVAKLKKEIDKLTTMAQKRESLLQEIQEVDTRLHSLLNVQKSTREQWKDIVGLCNKQKSQLSECKKNQWKLPNIQHDDLDVLISRYTHYSSMGAIDDLISSLKTDLSSKKQFVEFSGHCGRQIANITTCKNNGWQIPELVNSNPGALLKNAEIAKEKKEKAKKIKYRAVGIGAIAIAFLIFIAVCVHMSRVGKIQVPFDAEYAKGEDIQDIIEELEDAGFESINAIEDASGWDKDGSIISIAVDNESSFDKGDYYEPEVTITIKYSSKGRVDFIDVVKDWQSLDYNTVITMLNDAGFSNITTVALDTAEKEYNQLVANIELNGQGYSKGHCYLPLEAPIEITYYDLKLNMSGDNTSYVGQNYETVVEQLKSAGFTNVQTEEIVTGWAKGKSVVAVTVNNSTSYTTNDSISPDTKIIVRYSSDDRVDATSYFTKLDTRKYDSLQASLKSLGFSNISTIRKTTQNIAQNQLVSSVKIHNQVFNGGECYIQKHATVVIEYYDLIITLSKEAKDYEGEQYSQVVSELKQLGFSNITLKRTNDLINGWITKEGSIKSISINGDKKFDKNITVDYDASIVIVVNTFKNKGCSDITIIDK